MNDTREHLVQFRLTQKEWERLQALARAEGFTVNGYARDRALDANPASLTQTRIDMHRIMEDYEYTHFFLEMMMNFIQQSFVDVLAEIRAGRDGDVQAERLRLKGRIDDVMLRCAEKAMRYRTEGDQKYDPFWTERINESLGKYDPGTYDEEDDDMELADDDYPDQWPDDDGE